MQLSDRIEEVLEMMWISVVEEKKNSIPLGMLRGDPVVAELAQNGFIKQKGEEILFTEKGKSFGEKIVRRHRLAERLLTDLLDVKEKLVHPMSCKYEHLLQEGLEDNICILLGHPRTCPHGKSIPPGECCLKLKQTIEKVFSSLSNLRTGQKGRVAYIHTQDHKKLEKIMAMGILPGMNITLIEKYPSFVFQVGHSQFAIDEDLAGAIYLRLGKSQ